MVEIHMSKNASDRKQFGLCLVPTILRVDSRLRQLSSLQSVRVSLLLRETENTSDASGRVT